ncbi:hypothetical protein INR49_007070, partial [Caranx melampygus]
SYDSPRSKLSSSAIVSSVHQLHELQTELLGVTPASLHLNVPNLQIQSREAEMCCTCGKDALR